jgi:hypothetical protein
MVTQVGRREPVIVAKGAAANAFAAVTVGAGKARINRHLLNAASMLAALHIVP